MLRVGLVVGANIYKVLCYFAHQKILTELKVVRNIKPFTFSKHSFAFRICAYYLCSKKTDAGFIR